MKVRVWVVSTTIPERGEGPCMPAVFGSDVEAEAYADTMLRDEWNAAAIADGEADEAMPYPGAWRLRLTLERAKPSPRQPPGGRRWRP